MNVSRVAKSLEDFDLLMNCPRSEKSQIIMHEIVKKVFETDFIVYSKKICSRAEDIYLYSTSQGVLTVPEERN